MANTTSNAPAPLIVQFEHSTLNKTAYRRVHLSQNPSVVARSSRVAAPLSSGVEQSGQNSSAIVSDLKSVGWMGRPARPVRRRRPPRRSRPTNCGEFVVSAEVMTVCHTRAEYRTRIRKRSLDTQDADRANRCGDGEPEDDTL